MFTDFRPAQIAKEARNSSETMIVRGQESVTMLIWEIGRCNRTKLNGKKYGEEGAEQEKTELVGKNVVRRVENLNENETVSITADKSGRKTNARDSGSTQDGPPRRQLPRSLKSESLSWMAPWEPRFKN